LFWDLIENLPFGPTVGGIVPNVEDVDLLVVFERREQVAIVAGQGGEPNESIVLELGDVVEQPGIGLLVVPPEQEHVETIDAQLPEALLHHLRQCRGAAGCRVRNDDEVVPFSARHVPDAPAHLLCSKRSPIQVVHAAVHGLFDHGLVRAVARGDADRADRQPGPPECHPLESHGSALLFCSVRLSHEYRNRGICGQTA